MTLVPSSDGLPARQVHEWSDEKLHYVERYMDIFTNGMKNKWPRLVYADLFAGPGVCVEKETRRETRGSPLRALSFPFARLFFNDSDSAAVNALRMRTRSESPERLRIEQLDCNDAIDAARDFLFPAGSEPRTLGLAFIDPSAYQIRFESIRRLTAGVRLDLLITFMTSYPKRIIGQRGFDEGSEFDQFMGTREWLDLGGQHPARYFTRDLLDIYETQLKTLGYSYVDDSTRVLNSKRSTIYHLVFASKHERGAEFFRKISQREYSGQGRLPLDLAP